MSSEPSDPAIPTELPPNRVPRYSKLGFVLKSLGKHRERLILAIVLAAGVYWVTTIIQKQVVRQALYGAVREELGSWADQLVSEINYKDKWDLQGYRQASITAPAWNVITNDGLLVDVEGFIPGVFGKVEVGDESIFAGVKTVTTATGEKWRLLGKKMAGGFVIVGILSPEITSEADLTLTANIAKFGSTLASALAVTSREIAFDVDYAVVNSEGELVNAWGGVPLTTKLRPLPKSSYGLSDLLVKGKPYSLYTRTIVDSRGHDVATIILPKEMSAATKALQAEDTFNSLLAGFMILLALATPVWIVVRRMLDRGKKISLQDALRMKENEHVEFKSTLYWDVRQGRQIEERRLDVLKSVAAFLNTDGGTLFIGVEEPEGEEPRVRGLADDLKLVGGSNDKLKLMFRSQIGTRIGAEYSPLINDTIEENGGMAFWAITVQRAPEAAFVKWNNQEKFYIRDGNRTNELGGSDMVKYIKNHWG